MMKQGKVGEFFNRTIISNCSGDSVSQKDVLILFTPLLTVSFVKKKKIVIMRNPKEE